jgi:CDP-glucose 4,6-dehydratase
MESLKNFYKSKRVMVTGATGFKGSWLCAWLSNLGSRVYATGYNPNKNNLLFKSLKFSNKMNLKLFDIRDIQKLDKFVKKIRPQIIFHLAAQSLVIESYKKPYSTFDINFRGTLNILEISKKYKFIKSVICVTSDKVYENLGKIKSYKETDNLGGVDPYSASKSSIEILIKSYRESFFKDQKICGISSVRAGNVIGGGDWSENRLIPDCIKSLIKKKTIVLRNPDFSRPWQFVLEPLKGYLMLAQKQYDYPLKFSGSWNFGNQSKLSIKVIELVKLILKFWGTGKVKTNKRKIFKEYKNLQVDSTKAKKKLNWKITYSIKKAVSVTSEWYSDVFRYKKDPANVTFKQINQYTKKNNKF